MSSLLQDLRFGLRMLFKSPGFSAIALVTLAIGIGANTAIFSVVNTVLLRPLPYEDPERLALVFHHNRNDDVPNEFMSYDTFVDFRRQTEAFDLFAGVSPEWTLVLSRPDGPERVSAHWVSASFFPALGASPLHGRVFTEEEDRDGQPLTVVLSHRLWSSRFGSDLDVLGETIVLTGAPATIIGVMPPGFRFGEDVEAWVPLALNPITGRGRDVRWVWGLGRLAGGVSREEALGETRTIAARLADEYPDSNEGLDATVVGLHEHVVRESRTALLVLMGVVGFVLLIACVNVANLMMARAAARGAEVAIRTALGAGRGRLIRQFLTESVTLALAGGAAGLLVAYWGLDLIRSLSPSTLPRLHELSIDPNVLLFALFCSAATGIGFGLIPALQVTSDRLHDSLKEGGRFASGSAGGAARRVLVVGEVALALVLLIGSGLMIRSFVRLIQVDPGFDRNNLLTLQIGLPGDRYDAPQRTALFQDMFERLETLPGVVSAGGVTRLPLREGSTTELTIEGRPSDDTPQVEFRRASPGYFGAMGIPLIRGRLFEATDDLESTPVLLVNEAAARRYWPGADPVGRRARPFNPDPNAPWWTIVGVVGDVKHFGLDTEARPEVYISFGQGPPNYPLIALRTSGDPLQQIPAVRTTIRGIDPDSLVFDTVPMSDLVSDSLSSHRFNLTLLGAFAGLALILASIGIYGVLSYTVRMRTREIGVRMALGAKRGDIMRLMLGHGMRLTWLGVAVGLAASAGLTRLMASLLFGVSAMDPWTYAAVPALLLAVAFAACYLPARRATRVDPMAALHFE